MVKPESLQLREIHHWDFSYLGVDQLEEDQTLQIRLRNIVDVCEVIGGDIQHHQISKVQDRQYSFDLISTNGCYLQLLHPKDRLDGFDLILPEEKLLDSFKLFQETDILDPILPEIEHFNLLLLLHGAQE